MNPRLVYGAALLLLALAGIGAQSYYWPQIADDSFIFFRYAENLAAGDGLRWNRGATAVEGFSSPLWVLLLGALAKLGAPLLSAAKILGVASHALAVAGVGMLTQRLASSRLATGASMLCVILCDPLNYWAPSGMETSAYVALLSWSAFALVANRLRLAVALLGATGLARPESPGMVVVALAALAVSSGSGAPRRRILVASALALLPLAAYMAFRLSYFGEVLPNTYYAKVGGPFLTRLADGLLYIAPATLLWAGALLPAFLLWHKRSASQPDPRPLTLIFALATAALIPPLWSGGDWMWRVRFLCPAMPLLIASACAGTALLAQRRGWLAAAPAACSAAGFYLVGMVAPTTVIQGLAGERLPVAQIQEGRMTQVSRKVADFLRSKGQPTDLVAVNHAGALPYYSQMPTLDMTGLNDHHIAHRAVGALHGKFDPDYVLANKPRFVVLNSNVKPDSPQRLPNGEPVQWFYYPGYWAGETALWKHPEFLKRYRFTPKYWTWSWVQPRYILVAERIR